jgi:hypothetical protein
MKRSIARLLVAATAIGALAVSPAAGVGFVNGKNQWLALTPEAKAAYVQGLNDSINYVFVDDSLVEALSKRGRTKCLAATQTTAAVLADRITTTYQEDRFAGYSPTAIYIIRMTELCRPYINEERQAFGLGPI